MKISTVTKRELIKNLIAGKQVERCGLWIGVPAKDTVERYCRESGFQTMDEIREYLKDDVTWITPQYIASTYKHPNGKEMRPWKKENPFGLANGPLSTVTSVEEIEAIDWPETKYLDFTECLGILRGIGDQYRLSGFWSPFFHDLTYLLGTEDLLIKMCLYPEVVHAILDKLCNFYLEANELFYNESGDLMDGLFFGNDFGTQTDLLMDPQQFEEFFLPWIKRFSEQAHLFGYQSVLHSCGSIHRIINQLADAGVDCIHPIQSQARNMDAETLANDFKGRISFMGGIDTQQILPFGTPGEIALEVQRVKTLLGPNIIIGPSHEVLMSNVSYENAKAMAHAVLN